MKKIILASNSPRRKELLSNAGLAFDVIPSGYEETLDVNNFSYEQIENLAYNKALDVAKKLEDCVVIGADTVVVLGNRILTKPVDRDNAIRDLRALSDVEHKVITSVCVIDNYVKTTDVKSVTTRVHFLELTEQMIVDYVDNFKPYDKAGAYGIQELPPEYIKYVDGSLENVIGIDTKTVLSMIKA